MKRYYLFLITFMVSAGGLLAQSALDEYIEFALQNNPGLKSGHAKFEASLQKVARTGSLDDPNFHVSTLGQMVETRTGQQMAGFSLEQMFPWFGVLKEKRNAAALNAEAAYESFKSGRNELIFNVKEAYYPLYEIDEAIHLHEENLKILESCKVLAASKFQNGAGKLSDALRVDLMINDITTDIAILKEKRMLLVIRFNKLLNREEQAEVMVNKLMVIPNNTLVSRDSLTNNPQLEVLRKKVLAAQAQERLAVKQAMPKLGLGVEYIITQKRPEVAFSDNGKDAYMAMFSISLPIYQKKYKASIKESQFMQTSLKEMRRQVENNLITQYEMSNFKLKQTREQLSLYQKQVTRTNQIVMLMMTAYGNDKAEFEEILEMQRMLLKYELLKVKAEKEYAIAFARLEYLTSN